MEDNTIENNDNINQEGLITVHSILVRLGLTKSTFRRYKNAGVIVHHQISQKDNRTHLFSEQYVRVRIQILRKSIQEGFKIAEIGSALKEQFGEKDEALKKLLEQKSEEDIVKEFSLGGGSST